MQINVSMTRASHLQLRRDASVRVHVEHLREIQLAFVYAEILSVNNMNG